ncbi:hypothetical protein I4Q42_22640 [Caulobacter hibisci]|uniref:Uncharacterized protein n=1 Tax=Caulobacter hibisci TaxID=2035993 RepID=A0ABS0T6E3_9CAUL|nr:hypothetical protein [Caulobacter hibisci]
MSDLKTASLTDLQEHRLGLLVWKARQIRQAVTAFEQTWPPLPPEPPIPAFGWSQLQRQLTDLAPPELAPLVTDLVSAIRKESAAKPAEMVLREILTITATVLDEGFREKCAEDSTML